MVWTFSARFCCTRPTLSSCEREGDYSKTLWTHTKVKQTQWNTLLGFFAYWRWVWRIKVFTCTQGHGDALLWTWSVQHTECANCCRWKARFGLPSTWLSDQGTHFRNATIEAICLKTNTKQVFTPASSPWINGATERLNRDIIEL